MNPGEDSNKTQETTLSALQVAVTHSEGKEIERLRQENLKLRAALDRVNQQTKAKHDFYEHLVWRARSRTEDYLPARHEAFCQKHGDVQLAALRRAEGELADPDTGNWTHGFNSGVLAATRLTMGLTVMEDLHVCQGVHFHDDGSSSEESEDDKDDDDSNHRPVKVQKCGEDCYWTAEQQRQQAIDEFPDLDT